MSEQAPPPCPPTIFLCVIGGQTLSLDLKCDKRSERWKCIEGFGQPRLPADLSPLPVCRWETPHPLSLLPQRTAAPSGAEGRSPGFWKVFLTVLLQGEEVYKRLRSQVRGSQRRLCRCLRSALKAVLVPCTYEHNIISYIILQLCEDVFPLQIKSTGNGLARSGDDCFTLHCSQSHRDYPTQGSYYLIVAQIDYCLVLLKLVFMLFSGTNGVFPP